MTEDGEGVVEHKKAKRYTSSKVRNMSYPEVENPEWPSGKSMYFNEAAVKAVNIGGSAIDPCDSEHDTPFHVQSSGLTPLVGRNG